MRVENYSESERDGEEQGVVAPVTKKSRLCPPAPPGRITVKIINMAGTSSQLPEHLKGKSGEDVVEYLETKCAVLSQMFFTSCLVRRRSSV